MLGRIFCGEQLPFVDRACSINVVVVLKVQSSLMQLSSPNLLTYCTYVCNQHALKVCTYVTGVLPCFTLVQARRVITWHIVWPDRTTVAGSAA